MLYNFFARPVSFLKLLTIIVIEMQNLISEFKIVYEITSSYTRVKTKPIKHCLERASA